MSEPNKPTAPPESNEAKPASIDPATFATKEEMTNLRQTLETVNASLQALATARQEQYNAPAQPVIEPEPTLDQIRADLQENKPESLLKFVNSQVNKVRREEVEPLRTQGAQSLAAIARQTAINSGDMPYLKKLQKDVDAAFEKLPLQQRTTPEAYKAVYQYVAGAKLGEIVKEETEQAVRQGREQAPASQPGTQGARAAAQTPEGKTAFEQVFNDQAMQALNEQRKTPDEFARKMGFKNAEEYALFAVKQTHGETANA